MASDRVVVTHDTFLPTVSEDGVVPHIKEMFTGLADASINTHALTVATSLPDTNECSTPDESDTVDQSDPIAIVGMGEITLPLNVSLCLHHVSCKVRRSLLVSSLSTPWRRLIASGSLEYAPPTEIWTRQSA